MLQLINLLYTKMFIPHRLCMLKFQSLEHPQQMLQKKCHFDTLKTCFIILPHHFTISH